MGPLLSLNLVLFSFSQAALTPSSFRHHNLSLDANSQAILTAATGDIYRFDSNAQDANGNGVAKKFDQRGKAAYCSMSCHVLCGIKQTAPI